jgi:hypothetical protein
MVFDTHLRRNLSAADFWVPSSCDRSRALSSDKDSNSAFARARSRRSTSTFRVASANSCTATDRAFNGISSMLHQQSAASVVCCIVFVARRAAWHAIVQPTLYINLRSAPTYILFRPANFHSFIPAASSRTLPLVVSEHASTLLIVRIPDNKHPWQPATTRG